jgi:hypothetical protein
VAQYFGNSSPPDLSVEPTADFLSFVIFFLRWNSCCCSNPHGPAPSFDRFVFPWAIAKFELADVLGTYLKAASQFPKRNAQIFPCLPGQRTDLKQGLFFIFYPMRLTNF